MRINNLLAKSIFRLILIVSFLLAGFAEIKAQDSSHIKGVWDGVLQLKFVWKIDRDAQGNLTASLNIPGQKSYNIPVQKIVFKGDSLFMDINLTNSHKTGYVGKYIKEKNIIEGYYWDAAGRYPMNLTEVRSYWKVWLRGLIVPVTEF